MKKLLLIVFLVVQCGYAQKENSLYLTTSFDVGNYVGADLGVTLLSNNKYSYSFGYFVEIHDTENYPNDFYDDFPTLPIDYSSNFYFSFGRLLEFKKTNRFRLNLSVGVARTSGNRYYDYVRGEKVSESPDLYRYNYSIDTYKNYSFILNPKFEFIPTSFFGLYVSPKVVFNPKRIHYGIGIGIMLGKLR